MSSIVCPYVIHMIVMIIDGIYLFLGYIVLVNVLRNKCAFKWKKEKRKKEKASTNLTSKGPYDKNTYGRIRT